MGRSSFARYPTKSGLSVGQFQFEYSDGFPCQSQWTFASAVRCVKSWIEFASCSMRAVSSRTNRISVPPLLGGVTSTRLPSSVCRVEHGVGQIAGAATNRRDSADYPIRPQHQRAGHRRRQGRGSIAAVHRSRHISLARNTPCL